MVFSGVVNGAARNKLFILSKTQFFFKLLDEIYDIPNN